MPFFPENKKKSKPAILPDAKRTTIPIQETSSENISVPLQSGRPACRAGEEGGSCQQQ